MFDFPIHPERASTFADEIDVLYFALWALTILFTAIVFAMIIFFTVRYRRGAKVDRSRPVHTHEGLELTWSVIPLILGLMIFAWAAKLYADVYKVPANAKEIFVIGKQWMWHLQHTNGIRENNELHIPVGQPVKLTLISQDVIHSFFVPAFRIKRDAVPGRYTSVWFTPTKTGKYYLFCSEYCGTQHSLMGGYVYVMAPDDYQRWVESGGQKVEKKAPTLVEQGAELWNRLACGNCHGSVSNRKGPSLYGIYNAKRQLTNGKVHVADEDYLRESILEPNNKITKGYDGIAVMPVYKDQLKEEQVLALIEYIKALSPQESKAQPKPMQPSNPTSEPPARKFEKKDWPGGGPVLETNA